MVAVGAGSATDMVSFSAGELFSSEKKLLGCIYGSADVRTDFHRVLALGQAGRLDLTSLVSREIALDDINQAFADMDGGEVVRSVIKFAVLSGSKGEWQCQS
jgi:S-(hydroxymethyl)glutathione dehydrogenase/alcohol dehydrogenase